MNKDEIEFSTSELESIGYGMLEYNKNLEVTLKKSIELGEEAIDQAWLHDKIDENTAIIKRIQALPAIRILFIP